MTDICTKGGINAVETFSSKHPNRIIGVNLEQYVLEEYITLLENIIKECPYHVNIIEDAFYASKIMMVYYFSQDSNTGQSCWLQLGVTRSTLDNTFDTENFKSHNIFETELYKKPYSEWEPQQCESSCVAELDTIYREYAKSPACDTSNVNDVPNEFYEFRKTCEIFKNTDNPTCGNKNFAKIYKESANATTTITTNKNDICVEGGIKALNEYEFNVSFSPNQSLFSKTNSVNDKEAQDIISFSKRIMKECPEHSKYVEDEHYRLRIELVYAKSKDSVTGKQCKDVLGVTYNNKNGIYRTDSGLFQKPYSEWEPHQCESSCVAELDTIYRDFSKSSACDSSNDNFLSSNTYDMRKACAIFKTTGNPTCGNKNFAKIYEENTSNASTFTSHITLLALIMCILLIFFK